MGRVSPGWWIGAGVGAVIGLATTIGGIYAGPPNPSNLIYPLTHALIGAVTGGAISALSQLRRTSVSGAVSVWMIALGGAFVAVHVLDTIVEGVDLQLLLAFSVGASGGVGPGLAEVYLRTKLAPVRKSGDRLTQGRDGSSP